MAWRRLIIILVIGGIAFLLAERFGPGGRQRRGAREMHVFLERITPVISNDARFADVHTTTRTNPALVVSGVVNDAAALRDLTQICQAPPDSQFHVLMQVKVAPAPTTRATD